MDSFLKFRDMQGKVLNNNISRQHLNDKGYGKKENIKRQIILIIFILINPGCYGQEKKKNAIIYRSNGEIVQGKVNQDFAKKQEIKVYSGTKIKRIQKRKIDSILVDNDKYLIEKCF